MYHTIIIVGNLGRDPEMRYTPSGPGCHEFQCRCQRQLHQQQMVSSVERTIWIRVSAWGKQAETCNQYLKKGRKVLVEGRLVVDPATGGPRVYTRQDGTPASSFEVSASTVRFLSSKGETEEGASFHGGDAARPDGRGKYPLLIKKGWPFFNGHPFNLETLNDQQSKPAYPTSPSCHRGASQHSDDVCQPGAHFAYPFRVGF